MVRAGSECTDKRDCDEMSMWVLHVARAHSMVKVELENSIHEQCKKLQERQRNGVLTTRIMS